MWGSYGWDGLYSQTDAEGTPADSLCGRIMVPQAGPRAQDRRSRVYALRVVNTFYESIVRRQGETDDGGWLGRPHARFNLGGHGQCTIRADCSFPNPGAQEGPSHAAGGRAHIYEISPRFVWGSKQRCKFLSQDDPNAVLSAAGHPGYCRTAGILCKAKPAGREGVYSRYDANTMDLRLCFLQTRRQELGP